MKRFIARLGALLAAVLFLSITVLEFEAHARAGGSRSVGSGASRSYARPSASYGQPAPSRPQLAPAPRTYSPPAGGGFLRTMAGGIAGGMLGGMLFRGMGFAGPGAGMAGGGGGIGFFEILLLAGIGYLIYRYLTRQRSEIAPAVYNQYGQGIPAHYEIEIPAANALDAGLSQIRQRDPAFDERRCGDQIMDLFFKVQGGRMNRDLSALSGLLTAEMTGIFKGDLDRLLRERQVNRLENIAVRSVEISEAWQEAGQDYVTALIYANLLDYTTDEETGSIVSGSRTEPVKFEEYWTVTRPVGNNPWQLSAIGQP